MKNNNRVLKMYDEFRRFLKNAESEEFTEFFFRSVKSSSVNLSVFEKYVERRIDLRWVEAMENSIVAIDSIVRNPTRFIKQEEDIVPIAQARGIGPESIRHLSQHTNMISSVKNDEVTPNRILNITKEDSTETYENRFLFTLLRLASMFLDKRIVALLQGGSDADHFEYQLDGRCNVGVDKLDYHVDVKFDAPFEEVEPESLLSEDITGLSPLQRVDRLRQIFDMFKNSLFYRSLIGCTPVRPPLVLTNVLKKNQLFVKAVELWDFLNSYTEVGYEVERVERYRTPSDQDTDEMFAILMLQYVMMKKQCNKKADVTEETVRVPEGYAVALGKDAEDKNAEEVSDDANKIPDVHTPVEEPEKKDEPEPEEETEPNGTPDGEQDNVIAMPTPTAPDLSQAFMSNITDKDFKKALKNGAVTTNTQFATGDESAPSGTTVINVIAPNLIRRSIDELCESFSLTVDEVHKIYQKEIRKKVRKKENEFAKARGIFDRAIAFEKENSRAQEAARKNKIARELNKRFKLAYKEDKTSAK